MVPPVRPPAFEAFVAPARARPALWRLAAGIILAAALWIGAVAILLPLAMRLPGDPARLVLAGYLASFAGLALGTAGAARLLHRRPAATLLGPGGWRTGHFAAGVAAVAGLTLVALLVPTGAPEPIRQMPPATWAAWLPLALPLLLVQTAAEELAFRGYLVQALAARFSGTWVWLLLPAAAFGALHWAPDAFGANAPLVVLSTFAIGLVLADVTATTGNLSAAIGLHFANNVVSILLVSLPGPLAGLSLWLAAIDPADPAARPLLFLDLATILAGWAAWRGVRRLHSRGRGSI